MLCTREFVSTSYTSVERICLCVVLHVVFEEFNRDQFEVESLETVGSCEDISIRD